MQTTDRCCQKQVRPEDYELLGRLDEQVEKPSYKLCTPAQVGRFRECSSGPLELTAGSSTWSA
jgi:hypothetical protein